MPAASAAPRAKVRLHASIMTKLIAVTAVVVAVIAGTLAVYLPSRELEDLEAEAISQVAAYGDVMAGKLATATARGDAVLAQELLAAIAADHDVLGILLFSPTGDELFRYGTPSSWATPAARRMTTQKVFRAGDRIVGITPILTPGDDDGALIIELSTTSIVGQERAFAVTAAVIGVGALAFGAAAAFFLARSFVRRLRTIADIATEFSGDAMPQMVPVDSRDEIGILGDAINRMLTRLHDDRTRLRRTVSELTDAEHQLAAANRELEQRVAERTFALTDRNRQLRHEIQHRAEMEVELRQAHKLEAVGRLAAGIAHEINTPVQFVNDSCSFVDNASNDLLTAIAAYRRILHALETGAITPGESAERIRAIESEHDLAYVAEHIPGAIARMLQGLGRVSAIVRAMKEFAYPDRSEQAPADINRAITSTLMVAHNEYKYVADVETELNELPMVTCHIGELNQVVLNLIVNAAHAIETRAAGRGKIVVRTEQAGDQVVIAIEDNGCGIPDAVIDKIFDPFFTTKAVGKGTGQGLAIARAVVVDKHRGKLDVSSQVGSGTTFTISIPVAGAAPPAAAA